MCIRDSIGEFAVRPRFQGGGSSQVKATRRDALLDELRLQVEPAGGRVQYAPGYVLSGRDDRCLLYTSRCV